MLTIQLSETRYLIASVGIKKSVAPTISSYDDDPAEIDLSTISTQRPIPSASTTAPMDPFAAMMASMNGSTGGEGGFPGMRGAPGGDFLSQMMSSMATGSMPPTANGLSGTFPPTAPISPFINQKKTFIDRIFPFLHFLSMFSLACYAVFFAEPSYKVESLGLGEKVVDWSSWANLKYAAPVEFGTGMIGKLLYSGKGQLAAVVSI